MKAGEAVARLSKENSECDHEHQAISEEVEAFQKELRLSTEIHAQGQEVQGA